YPPCASTRGGPMTKIAGKLTVAVVLLVFGATAAKAHHVQGQILCDADGSGTFTGADTPVNGVTVKAVSQVASPGTTFTDSASGHSFPATNPGPGNWRIDLPGGVTDNYLVSLVAATLPPGSSIILPVGGTFLAHIVTGNPATDHVDGINFLLTGCVPGTTTT